MYSFGSLARRSLLAIATLAAVGLASPSASATPIFFEFTGTGSGNLDANSFFDVFFEVQIAGDTDDINFDFGPDVPQIAGLSGTISLTGIGLGTFADSLYVFNNQSNEAVGFGSSSQFDLIDLFAPGVGLDTYGLDTSFGPISSVNLFFGQFLQVDTSLGSLTFDTVREATFQATLGVIPEPASILVLASGAVCLGLAGLRARHARRLPN